MFPLALQALLSLSDRSKKHTGDYSFFSNLLVSLSICPVNETVHFHLARARHRALGSIPRSEHMCQKRSYYLLQVIYLVIFEYLTLPSLNSVGLLCLLHVHRRHETTN